VGFPPNAVAFDIEVYDVNLRATVAAYLAEQDRKAAERKARRAALTQHALPHPEES
jgi:hypothetical protein